MDDTGPLPNDLAECHRLLLAAFKQSMQMERQAADAEQQVAELTRVLDETATSYEELRQEHAATLDELAWYKRWTYGRKRERLTEVAGQGHLFELDSVDTEELSESTPPEAEGEIEVKGHRRRKKREIQWDKLPQIRHEHDLTPEEKICSCCGQPMECIGEDVTREWNFNRLSSRRIFTCVPSTPAVAARTVSRPLPCQRGRFPVASPDQA